MSVKYKLKDDDFFFFFGKCPRLKKNQHKHHGFFQPQKSINEFRS